MVLNSRAQGNHCAWPSPRVGGDNRRVQNSLAGSHSLREKGNTQPTLTRESIEPLFTQDCELIPTLRYPENPSSLFSHKIVSWFPLYANQRIHRASFHTRLWVDSHSTLPRESIEPLFTQDCELIPTLRYPENRSSHFSHKIVSWFPLYATQRIHRASFHTRLWVDSHSTLPRESIEPLFTQDCELIPTLRYPENPSSLFSHKIVSWFPLYATQRIHRASFHTRLWVDSHSTLPRESIEPLFTQDCELIPTLRYPENPSSLFSHKSVSWFPLYATQRIHRASFHTRLWVDSHSTLPRESIELLFTQDCELIPTLLYPENPSSLFSHKIASWFPLYATQRIHRASFHTRLWVDSHSTLPRESIEPLFTQDCELIPTLRYPENPPSLFHTRLWVDSHSTLTRESIEPLFTQDCELIPTLRYPENPSSLFSHKIVSWFPLYATQRIDRATFHTRLWVDSHSTLPRESIEPLFTQDCELIPTLRYPENPSSLFSHKIVSWFPLYATQRIHRASFHTRLWVDSHSTLPRESIEPLFTQDCELIPTLLYPENPSSLFSHKIVSWFPLYATQRIHRASFHTRVWVDSHSTLPRESIEPLFTQDCELIPTLRYPENPSSFFSHKIVSWFPLYSTQRIHRASFHTRLRVDSHSTLPRESIEPLFTQDCELIPTLRYPENPSSHFSHKIVSWFPLYATQRIHRASFTQDCELIPTLRYPENPPSLFSHKIVSWFPLYATQRIHRASFHTRLWVDSHSTLPRESIEPLSFHTRLWVDSHTLRYPENPPSLFHTRLWVDSHSTLPRESTEPLYTQDCELIPTHNSPTRALFTCDIFKLLKPNFFTKI